MSQIELNNVSIQFQSRSILKNVNFVFSPKSISSIMGPSGVGKTTLLRSMNRLLEDERGYTVKGIILLNGKSISDEPVVQSLRRKIGLIFQRPILYPISILKNVLFGVHHLKLVPKKNYLETAERYLRQTYLWDEVKDRLNESALKLSAGQQQRLSIARSLAVEPEVLLFDEPTSALDSVAEKKIEELIVEQSKNKTVVLVTHDKSQAERLSKSLLYLEPNHV